MKIEKTFEINAPIQSVWEFLSEPTKVVTCVPGAKITEQIDELNYKGVVEVKIGPMLTKYQGNATLDERDNENYKLSLTGKGMETKGKGSASMNMTGGLAELDGQGTQVESSMHINISGKIAQLGSRMIKAVSDQMFEDFKKNLTERLENPDDNEDTSEKESEPIKAIPLMLGIFWRGITSPFRRFYRWVRG